MTGHDRIGVGVIALGMGMRHVEAAIASPRARLVGIADIDPVRLEQVRQQVSPDVATTDYRELLANPAIDLIVVASPDPFHRDQTVEALQAGKHVLVEKPMAPTVAECQDMVDAAKAANKSLFVGHIVRFTPAFATVKKVVESGDLGQVYFVGTSYEHDYSRLARKSAWRFDPKYSRHQFLGGGCHAVDLLRFFLPDTNATSAVANHFSLPESPNDDCIAALYRTASGAVGRVLVTAGCKRPYGITLQVYGTEGTFDASNVETSMRYWTNSMPGLGHNWMQVPVESNNHPADLQLDHCISAIRGEVAPIISGEEGMKTVQLAVASIEASHSDQWVSVS